MGQFHCGQNVPKSTTSRGWVIGTRLWRQSKLYLLRGSPEEISLSEVILARHGDHLSAEVRCETFLLFFYPGCQEFGVTRSASQNL